MTTPTKLTAEAVTAAIRDMNGNISAVARRLGVCRQTVYSYIERHPSVKDVLAESRETMLDNAESALYRAVLNGEAWAGVTGAIASIWCGSSGSHAHFRRPISPCSTTTTLSCWCEVRRSWVGSALRRVSAQ